MYIVIPNHTVDKEIGPLRDKVICARQPNLRQECLI